MRKGFVQFGRQVTAGWSRGDSQRETNLQSWSPDSWVTPGLPARHFSGSTDTYVILPFLSFALLSIFPFLSFPLLPCIFLSLFPFLFHSFPVFSFPFFFPVFSVPYFLILFLSFPLFYITFLFFSIPSPCFLSFPFLFSFPVFSFTLLFSSL